MKKFLCVLSVLTIACAAWAEWPTGDFPQDSQTQQMLFEQAEQSKAQAKKKEKKVSFNQDLYVRVKITVKEPQQNEDESQSTSYLCSGIIYDEAGDVAIRKDCAPALEKARNSAFPVSLFIDMEALGSDEEGIPFSYETDNMNVNDFIVTENFLVYPSKLQADSPIKEVLNHEFLFRSSLKTKKIIKIVDSLPDVVVIKSILFSKQA